MTSVICSVNDADLENTSPHLIFCVFVAARFSIAQAKTLTMEILRKLDLLVYGLNICGQRWHLARRIEKVIRTAIAEHNVPLTMTSLPLQFYDLLYSSLDIDEAPRLWAEKLELWTHLPGLESTPAG